MKKNKEMKIGMLLNYISMALEGIIVFLLNPFIIRGLGQETYGVYSLMNSITGYLSVFEFGLGTTIIRYISKYNEEKNEETKENFLSMIFGIYFWITILIVVLSVILYFFIDDIFCISLNNEQINLAKKIFIIIASSISITTIGSVFSAIISGYEKFIFSRSVVLITTILNILLTLLVLIINPSAILLSSITLIISIITILLNIIYVFYKLKVKVKFHGFESDFFVEIFKFSIFIFLQTLINQIYWRVDQLIIGVELVNAATSLAVYAVAMKINDLVLAFTTVVNRYQLPTITKLMINKREDITEYIGKISRFVAILYLAIIIGFIFYGKRFIEIYAGEGYDQAYIIVLIVVISASLSRIHGVGADVLKAINSHGVYTLTVFISAILNIILTIFLIPKYGIIGAAIGTALSVIIGNTIAYYWCLYKKANISILLLFKITFKGFPTLCIISIIYNIIVLRINDSNIIVYLGKGIVFCIIYLLSVYNIILDTNSKDKIKKMLKRGK